MFSFATSYSYNNYLWSTVIVYNVMYVNCGNGRYLIVLLVVTGDKNNENVEMVGNITVVF